jgi:hypothetical protein
MAMPVVRQPKGYPVSSAMSPRSYVFQDESSGHLVDDGESPDPTIDGESPMSLDDYSMWDDYSMGYDDCTSPVGSCGVSGGLLGTCGGGMGWVTDQCHFYGGWGGVEYTQAWAKGRSIPVLAVTGDSLTTLNQELFGGERIGNDTQSGGRFTAGLWLDPCQTIGIGTRLFGLEGDSTGFHQDSRDLPSGLLGIPYFDLLSQSEDAIMIGRGNPGQLEGTLGVRTAQDVLTAEAFLRTLLARGHGYRLDLIGGYHYSHIRDGLQIMGNSVVPDTATGSLLPDGSTISLMDHFDARNNFHGGELGMLGELRHGRWRVRTLGKVSLGNMRQTVTVSGQTTITVPEPNAAVAVDPNGLFAQASNSGTFSRDETAFIPEASLTLGYLVTNHLELSVGYSFIYWSDVVLAGEQIDRVVDLTAAGGGPVGTRPAMDFRQTDFWVQGVNIGMNWNY